MAKQQQYEVTLNRIEVRTIRIQVAAASHAEAHKRAVAEAPTIRVCLQK